MRQNPKKTECSRECESGPGNFNSVYTTEHPWVQTGGKDQPRERINFWIWAGRSLLEDLLQKSQELGNNNGTPGEIPGHWNQNHHWQKSGDARGKHQKNDSDRGRRSFSSSFCRDWIIHTVRTWVCCCSTCGTEPRGGGSAPPGDLSWFCANLAQICANLCNFGANVAGIKDGLPREPELPGISIPVLLSGLVLWHHVR